MITHNIIQGTPEWHQHRINHFNASDAPAMMGVSPHKTRNELLRELSMGLTAEVDAATQRRFDDGHRFEALARPLAEEIIGEELYPCVGSEGKYSASFDGITLTETVCFEHKMSNDDIRKALAGTNIANVLPDHYCIQMEQQCMVSGATRCLFMATRWNDAGEIEEKLHAWYEPNHDLRQRIVAGWAQFEKDLADYQHVEAAPAVVGRAPDALPALRIEVTGMVTASNLAEIKAHALAVFDGIKTSLQTDEDFANAEKTTKWCKDAEDRLEAAKQHALSQTASIDELFRTIDAIKEEARQKRLTLEKLVKSRKDSIRVEIMQEAQAKLSKHVSAANDRLGWYQGVPLISVAAADFNSAIKGLKTVDSVRNAVDTELAKAKIAVSELADRIAHNLEMIKGDDYDHTHLFPDFPAVCAKEPVDFDALLTSRQVKETQRLEEIERQKHIVAETMAKAEADAQRKAAEASATVSTEEAKKTQVEMPAHVDRSNVVIAHQDEISAFMRSREWNGQKEINHVRAILCEFVKFQESRRMKEAA